jgi:hypothetical protein
VLVAENQHFNGARMKLGHGIDKPLLNRRLRTASAGRRVQHLLITGKNVATPRTHGIQ